jgi:intein/homing endonuclease
MKMFRYVQPYVHYDKTHLPLDARFLGIWLGDGTTSNTSVTNIDCNIINYVYSIAAQHGLKVTKDDILYSMVNKKGHKNALRDIMRKIGIFNNKHIPIVYLQSSKKTRLELLAGLIDTDGSLEGHGWEIQQRQETLAYQIVELARSLGFFTSIKDKWSCATNTAKKTKRCYKRIKINVNHNTPDVPLLLAYKQFDKANLVHIKGPCICQDVPDKKHKNIWTAEMKSALVSTASKYMSVKGAHRIDWTEFVKNEELYSHLTPSAVRAYYRKMQTQNTS